VILTLRRDRDDVFLIGEEQLLPDQESGAGEAPTVVIEGVAGDTTRDLPRPLPTGSLRGARGLALLGLVAAAAAFVATLQLVGGRGPSRPAATSSPRRALIARPPVSAAAGRVTHLHRRVARPAAADRLRVVHPRSRRHQGPSRNRRQTTPKEPEREPTTQVAPVSSEAPATEPVPVSEEVPAAAGTEAPPEPSPSSGGGGPGGVESFGFER
jgi:hypothetical protein